MKETEMYSKYKYLKMSQVPTPRIKINNNNCSYLFLSFLWTFMKFFTNSWQWSRHRRVKNFLPPELRLVATASQMRLPLSKSDSWLSTCLHNATLEEKGHHSLLTLGEVRQDRRGARCCTLRRRHEKTRNCQLFSKLQNVLPRNSNFINFVHCTIKKSTSWLNNLEAMAKTSLRS